MSAGWDEYLISSNRVRFGSIGTLIGAGAYRISAHAAVLANPFGTALDGDGNGTGGDSWTRTFFTCGSNVLVVDNCESGTGWSVANTTLTGTASGTSRPRCPWVGACATTRRATTARVAA